MLGRFQESISLSAFEFFSELTLQKVLAHRALPRPLENAVDFYALIEFDESALDAAGAAFEQVQATGWVNDGVLSQSQSQARALWQLREGISESIAGFTPYKNDLSVRVSAMPEFVDEVERRVRAS